MELSLSHTLHLFNIFHEYDGVSTLFFRVFGEEDKCLECFPAASAVTVAFLPATRAGKAARPLMSTTQLSSCRRCWASKCRGL